MSVDIFHSFIPQTSIDYMGGVGEGWVIDRELGGASALESGYLLVTCLGKSLNNHNT